MKGRNLLHLNETTVIEALQEYFDRRIVGRAPTVTDIAVEWQESLLVFKVEVDEDAKRPSDMLPTQAAS